MENFDDSSNSSSGSSNSKWLTLIENVGEEDVSEYINIAIPKSKAYQTNHDLNCRNVVMNNVQLNIMYYYAKKNNISNISIKHDHNHAVDQEYNNYNGLPEKVKIVVKNLVDTNPKLIPRQVRTFLNNNATKLGIDDITYEFNQITMAPRKNKIEDVERYLADHLYFPTIDPNQPFFFGFLTDDNQDHSLFHIDGTYKITFENYPLLVFGRSNPNRILYPIFVCRLFNINFNLKFMMQDAQIACASAVNACFPGVKV
ncbi:hypothetical protein BpHYR1_045741 [Brachionus plicatilis]|uniref:MULE transposase domain-containing protein n=1 Tax=Brachionus plicatilis TaxID=10195 RepID=A0A3M7Q6P5_BRAPC|nr:hypothetical protein BpHYR1_045741 [Brachionus plicatilis]